MGHQRAMSKQAEQWEGIESKVLGHERVAVLEIPGGMAPELPAANREWCGGRANGNDPAARPAGDLLRTRHQGGDVHAGLGEMAGEIVKNPIEAAGPLREPL